MGLKLSRMCLLPVTLVWARSRAWLNPLIAVCGGQQSSVSLHFLCQAWHSCLQLVMCRWQHLPSVLSSSKAAGDGDDQFSVLQKKTFRREIWIFGLKEGGAGCWWVLMRSTALGPCLWAIVLEMVIFLFQKQHSCLLGSHLNLIVFHSEKSVWAPSKLFLPIWDLPVFVKWLLPHYSSLTWIKNVRNT